ncbi:RHS repeat-associated core domain-containing protein [Streptomyces griseoluteus]|uniref:hypothetical protein n=1 Tax=Streptomyces griseoluteus TaxID=29306 RepID=UPI003703530D
MGARTNNETATDSTTDYTRTTETWTDHSQMSSIGDTLFRTVGQEQSPYLYAEGDPVNRIDPTGMYRVADTVDDAGEGKPPVWPPVSPSNPPASSQLDSPEHQPVARGQLPSRSDAHT